MESSVQILSREQRIRKFGFDCQSELEWHDWEPGGEYAKKLVIKNVAKNLQTIKYRLPDTKFFFMNFPEKIPLSAGMSFVVNIKFRPIEEEEYDDVVEFETPNGHFFIRVKATLRRMGFEACKAIDFGYCPVNEISSRDFEIRNTGELSLDFSWDVAAPFSLEPMRGTLKTGDVKKIRVNFLPADASVLVGKAVCTISNGKKYATKLSGIGKFPFIRPSDADFHFGEVFVGQTLSRTLQIRNLALVHASVNIERVDTDEDNVFSFSKMKFTIPPESMASLEIKFTPTSSGMLSADEFHVSTPGGNSFRVRCRGQALGPHLTLSRSSIAFGDAEVGKSVTRVLEIQNHSPVAAEYDFRVDPSGVYSSTPSCGTIPPNASRSVSFHFSPSEPINYYRRVVCFVRDEKPMTLDLVGSGFNDKVRPATMKLSHIAIFRTRALEGKASLSPEELERQYEEGEEIDLTETKRAMSIPKDDSKATIASVFSSVVQRSGDVPFSFDVPQLEFGSTDRFSSPVSRSVTVRNHTNGKVMCTWTIRNGSGEESNPFNVLPHVQDINPKSSCVFRVTFNPKHDLRYFASDLDCFIMFKSMRTFRLVRDRSFVPPWCLSLPCSGNTFSGTSGQLIPKATVKTKAILFPPVHVSNPATQTLVLKNPGDNPLHFDALVSGGCFSCVPLSGVVPAGEIRILLLRFLPNASKSFSGHLVVELNKNPSASYRVRLLGTGYSPALEFVDNDRVVFRPTYTGTSSSRQFVVKNISRLRVRYRWVISRNDTNFIQATPPEGLIDGNTIQNTVFTFTPKHKKSYRFRVSCEVLTSNGDEIVQSRSLELVGEGSGGKIAISPEFLDFGPVMIGSKIRRKISLYNSSDCTLQCRLFTRKMNDDGTVEESSEKDPRGKSSGIILPHAFGEVASCTTLEIPVVFRPPGRGNSKYRLYCHTSVVQKKEETPLSTTRPGPAGIESMLPPARYAPKTDPSSLELKVDLSELPSIVLSGDGEHPHIEIVDLRVEDLSRALMWNMFSINEWNEVLSMPVDPVEFTAWSVFPFREWGERIRNVTLDFGAEVEDTDPSVVLLKFKNTSSVPLKFFFRYPNESETDIEHWVETAEKSQEEAKQEFLIDRRLFNISPKSGKLGPGQSVAIEFSYYHEIPDEDCLSVLFEVSKGKKVYLNLKGRTLAVNERYIQCPSRFHKMIPIPIGETKVPIQYYDLLNPGAEAVEYEIDPTAIDELTEKSHGFEVLRCLDPSGVIPAGQSLSIRWVFQPLTDEELVVDVPIRIVGSSDSPKVVTFLAKGYHPHVDGNEEYIAANEFNPLPGMQSLVLSDQLVRMSSHCISMGRMPSLTTEHRMLVITNICEDNVEFEITVPDPRGDENMTVVPAKGKIQAGKSCACKVSLRAGSIPQFVDYDIFVRVINSREKTEFEEEKDRVRREHEEARAMGEEGPLVGRSGTFVRQSVTIVPESYKIRKEFPETVRGDFAAAEGTSTSVIMTESAMHTQDIPSHAVAHLTEPTQEDIFLRIRARVVPVDRFCGTESNDALSSIVVASPAMAQGVSQADDLLDELVTEDVHSIVRSALEDLLRDAVDDPMIDRVRSTKHPVQPFHAPPPSKGPHIPTQVGDMREEDVYRLLENTFEDTLFKLLAESVVDNVDLTTPPRMMMVDKE